MSRQDGITAHIEAISTLLRVEEGSLYPALHRMEEAGWIRAKWTTTENKRRARIYSVTEAGRKQLADEEHRWTSITAAVGQVLEQA
jgi:PadR family transcriptional regulator PadR